ncbi:MAG: amidohydrolase [Clostridia bacterium]
MKILFKNAKILDLSQETGFIYGDVLVENEVIKQVGNKINTLVDQVIDVEENILMPGFINAHAHTPMTFLRGYGSDLSTEEWLEKIIPQEEKFSDEDLYYSTMLGICESIKAGITTTMECYFNLPEIIKAYDTSGMRGVIGVGFGKPFKKVTEQNLKKQLENVKKSKLCTAFAYAHSIYGTKESELEQICLFAKVNNLPVAIHLAETLLEVGKCTTKNQCTPAEYLEKLGYFDRNCTCFHCVHMDKDDLQILADHNVNVVSCPSSNIKLASGIAPLHAMQNLGLNIGLGTDSVASNNSLDMFKEMFLSSLLTKVNIGNAKVITAKNALLFSTIGGAKCANLCNVGQIKQGYLADIILINTKSLHFQPKTNALSHLVYSAKSSDVYFTMINGKILYQNSKLANFVDEKLLLKKANEFLNKI